MNGLCKDCRFWLRDGVWPDQGECFLHSSREFWEAAVQDGDPMPEGTPESKALVSGGAGAAFESLLTDADFGCVQFSARAQTGQK